MRLQTSAAALTSNVRGKAVHGAAEGVTSGDPAALVGVLEGGDVPGEVLLLEGNEAPNEGAVLGCAEKNGGMGGCVAGVRG
jgi:hypothetical protein